MRARRRGQVRRGAGLCGSRGAPVQGGQRLSVTSRCIPGRQAGPGPRGPGPPSPPSAASPCARTLNHTHTCSGRFVQLVRNVKDPDPLCLAQDPTPRLKLPARAHIQSHQITREVGETPPTAPRRPPAQVYLLPCGPEEERSTGRRGSERIQKKRQEKLQEESGGERLEEKEEGRERDEESMNRGARGRKKKQGVGEGWAEVERWWRSAEARGTSLQPRPQPPPPLQESLFALLAPSSLGAASVDLLFRPSFVLGVLAPCPRTAAPSRISMTRSLLGS